VAELNDVMAQTLPGYSWDHMLDCLMTTACTGEGEGGGGREEGEEGEEGGGGV